ncbi:MAG: putative sulfate exporter family transporter [Methanocorpusculum sp.]|uniref:YeiH family protein n=1 Tax=Methanocorpusculum sp. TaxID=2058474 RepID=UPI0027223E75|nr:putative sulfate exporter family transporter [Methanocorpusculum sp.]MDO9522373.1 putative sulfate exporter family transporter [Methanocorpusculum sp.]
MSSYREDFRDYFRFHRGLIPGILVCIIVALVSYLLTRGTLWEGGFRILPAELFTDNPVFYFLSKIGPIVLALIICIFINVRKFEAGGSYAGKYILRIAIILMGARVTYDVLMTGSLVGLIIILCVLAGVLIVAMLIGKGFKFPWDAAVLTGTGNGICGVSATLSVAPVINADKKHVDAVVGVISLLGIVGVFVIPAIASFLSMTPTQAEVFIGGTLHEIGNVIPAADLYYSITGSDVGALALAYKMIRVAMLVVVATVFGWMYCRRQKKQVNGSCPTEKAKIQGFLILFVIMAVLMSLVIYFFYDPGKAIQALITNISVTILTIAMAGVGLSMNLKDTLSTGKKLLPFGIAVWLFQIVAMCILIMLFV